jgi:hypothetical protein
MFFHGKILKSWVGELGINMPDCHVSSISSYPCDQGQVVYLFGSIDQLKLEQCQGLPFKAIVKSPGKV